MPQNDWPDFATNPGAAILSQAAYAALPDMVTGVPNGVWDQQNINAYLQHALKAMSIIASVLNAAGLDAINAADGSHTAITANFLTAISGRFTGAQLFATPGSPTYTPTAGTKKILVKMIGAGGGGGGCLASAASAVSIAAGGGAGAYAEHMILSGLASSYALVIGSGGSGGSAGGNPGSAGGNTTFGSIVTCTGGGGGPAGGSATMPATTLAAGTGGAASGANLINAGGASAALGYGLAIGQTVGSAGANSYYGGGGRIVFGTSGSGLGAQAGGAGGSGGISQNGGAAQAGGSGGNGSIIIFEYA